MIPNTVKEICELFDTSVKVDYAERGFSKVLSPVYAIGDNTELSAGLYGYTLTPWYFSQKQLERFCKSSKGKAFINDKAVEAFTDWDKESQNWKN